MYSDTGEFLGGENRGGHECPLCAKRVIWLERCPECGIQVCSECLKNIEIPLHANTDEMRTLRICKRCYVWMEHH